MNKNIASPVKKQHATTLLPNQTPSLLRTDALAHLEHILKTDHIIEYYKKANLADVRADFRNIPELGMYRCEATDLVHFWPCVAGKASLYEQLQRHPWYYLDEKAEYHTARLQINTGDSVLEVGCGLGNFAALIQGTRYAGLEYNEQAVAACRSKGLNVFAGTLESFAPNHVACFDVVCAFQVLEHLPDPREFIKLCLLCLKPGGRLIFSVPSASGFAAKVPNYCLNLPPHHCTQWSDLALHSLQVVFDLSEVQLIPMALERIHYAHYCDALAGYEACRKVGISHILVEPAIWDKIGELKTALLPTIAHTVLHDMPPRGHDIVMNGVKKQ